MGPEQRVLFECRDAHKQLDSCEFLGWLQFSKKMGFDVGKKLTVGHGGEKKRECTAKEMRMVPQW